jgi:hypothetical protein
MEKIAEKERRKTTVIKHIDSGIPQRDGFRFGRSFAGLSWWERQEKTTDPANRQLNSLLNNLFY